MNGQQHIVKRQVLDIQAPSVAEPDQLQDRFSEIYRRKVIPVIEEVCATFAGDDICIRLDEISLDVGEMYLDEFDEQFADRVRDKLTYVLGAAIVDMQGKRPERITVVPAELARLEMLDAFLDEGRYPWWTGKGAALPETHLEKLLVEQPAFLQRWLQNIRSNAGKYRRFLLQLPAGLQGKLRALNDMPLASEPAAGAPQAAPMPPPPKRESAAPKAQRPIAQLGMFLRSGQFHSKAFVNADALLLACLETAPDAVFSILQEIAGAKTLRRRLIQALQTESLLVLLRSLEPAHAPVLEAFYSEIVEVIAEDPPQENSEADIREMTLEVIFTYLLSQRGTQFNEQIFVRDVVTQLARAHRIDYAVFLLLLADSAAALLRRNFVPRTRLLTILLALRNHHLAEVPPPAPVAKAAAPLPAWQIALAYLHKGEWPEIPEGSDAEASETWLLALLDRRPAELQSGLRQLFAAKAAHSSLPPHSARLLAASLTAIAPEFAQPAGQLLSALSEATAALRLSAFEAAAFAAMLWREAAKYYAQAATKLVPGRFFAALLPRAAEHLSLPTSGYFRLLQVQAGRPAGGSSSFRLALQATANFAPEWASQATESGEDLAQVLALAQSTRSLALDADRIEDLLHAASPTHSAPLRALAKDLQTTLLRSSKGHLDQAASLQMVWQAIFATLADGYAIEADPQAFLAQVLRHLARLSGTDAAALTRRLALALRGLLLNGQVLESGLSEGLAQLELRFSGTSLLVDVPEKGRQSPRDLLRGSLRTNEMPAWLARLPRARAVKLWLQLAADFAAETRNALPGMQAGQLAWLLDFLQPEGVQRLVAILYPGQFADRERLIGRVRPAAQPRKAAAQDRFAAISQLLLNGASPRGLVPSALADALNKWLAQGGPAALALLKGLLRDAGARERLLAFLPEAALAELVQRLLPAEEADLSDLVQALRALGVAREWLVLSDRDFVRRVWVGLLDMALVQDAGRLDRARVFALMLAAFGPLANEDGAVWERSALLAVLPGRFARVVDLLVQEGRGMEVEGASLTRKWLAYFLRYGSFPVDCIWQDAAAFGKAYLAFMDAAPRQLERLFAAAGWDNEHVHRLLALVPGDLRLPAGITVRGRDRKRIHSRALMDWLDAFLANSRAPWWSGEVFDADRMAAEIASKVLKAVSDATAEALSVWLRHTSRWPLFIALFRDEQLLREVLGALFPKLFQAFHALSADFLKVAQHVEAGSTAPHAIRDLLWRALLSELEQHGPQAVNFDKIIIRSLRELARLAGSEYQAFFLQNVAGARASALTPYIFSSDLPQRLMQLYTVHFSDPLAPPVHLPVSYSPKSSPPSTAARFQEFYAKLEKGEWPVSPSRPKLSDKDSSWNKLTQDEEEGDAMYVGNAGLVLMWPFYGQFFKRLGLREGNDFVDDTAKVKAAHILQFLVTGSLEHPEYALTLNKALCGIPLDEPVARFVALSAEEMAECEDLLRSVIANWSALGATKPDTFRTSFLQREGALFQTGKGLKLRVAGTPFDMLMKQLPWTIGLIRTRWIQQPIFVEWKPS